VTSLVSPLTVGRATARTRLLFGPHPTNLGDGRRLSARHTAYYRRRAAGGTGIVVTEEASVHDSDWPYERAPLAAVCQESWAQVGRACHDEGALVLAALGHAGGQGASALTQAALWAPSPVPEVITREVPKAMEPDDIAAVVAGFADATRLAVAAGLDGVEVNAGQHSLVRQFLSGLTNLRADAWGSDRLRFAREVLTAVRAAAGDALVGLRLSCDELAPWAGITPEQACGIAAALAPSVDYLVVVVGGIYSVPATRPDSHTPPGFALATAALVRAAVDPRVRVVVQGSIVDVGLAEDALRDGTGELVEMTRAQIADPDLGVKVALRTPERVRPCILCNQNCMVRDVWNPLVSCVAEPSAGHELSDPLAFGAAGAPEDVLVVGGGPGGLECARVAALRGHRVTLRERGERCGGALRVAAAGAGRARLAHLADWLEAECRRLGVTVETGRAVTVPQARAHPGPVVWCTGGRRGPLDVPVDPGAVVLDAAEVLAGGPALLPEGPVAVWDPLGGPIAVSVAELLAPERSVALLSPDHLVGSKLHRTGDLAPASVRLQIAGVALHRRVRLRRVTPAGAVVEDVFSGAQRTVGAVAVVTAGHRLPADDVAAGGAWPVAGDAVAPRTVYEAVLEGRRAALAITRSPAGAGAAP